MRSYEDSVCCILPPGGPRAKTLWQRRHLGDDEDGFELYSLLRGTGYDHFQAEKERNEESGQALVVGGLVWADEE